jgi:hypothetical protein
MKVNEMRSAMLDEEIEILEDDEDDMDRLELKMNAGSSPNRSKRSSPEKAAKSKRTEEEIKEHAKMLNYECEETD